MASTLIHICIAKKINQTLNYNEKHLYLGTIAPDISKLIGEKKCKTHFLKTLDTEVPDVNVFLNKYKDKIRDPFVMGYLIHLYTDKHWFDSFIPNKFYNTTVKILDGTIITLSEEKLWNLIYNDYTNLDSQLIDYYNLDLSLFYEPIPYPNNIIEEIQLDKLQLLINKAGQIIMNTKRNKDYIFDITDIINFIEECSNEILQKIKNII